MQCHLCLSISRRPTGVRRFLPVLAAVCVTMLLSPAAVAFSVQGQVFDGKDDVVPAARVWLVQDRDVRQSTTNNNGDFEFEKVGVGEVQVVVLKEGLALGGFTGFLVSDFQIRIRLLEPDTLTLRIINQDFFPVGGARIRRLFVVDGFAVPVELLAEHGFPAARSGEDGLLAFPQLPKGGAVQLSAAHFKYAETFAAYLPVGGERQDIVLYRGLQLRGRVTAGTEPVAEARVSVYRAGLGGGRAYADILSDPEGYYSVRVPRGEYQVRVLHPRYAAPEPASVTLTGETESVVADLKMVAPRVIEGGLRFPDGTPAPGIEVVFRAGEITTATTRTDAEGAFHLTVGKPEGVLHIMAPPGFMTETLADIPVKLGDEVKAAIKPVRLLELPRVQGSATLPGGAPTGRLLISSLDLPYPVWAISDEQGRFDLRLAYAPEKEAIHFRVEHAAQLLRKDFEVDAKQPKPVALTLEPFTLAETPPALAGGNDLSSLAGKPAPELKCSDWFNTQALTLASLKGKVVVLYFWAGFDDSPQGRSGLEEMRALYDLLGAAPDVAFLGVHDETADADEVEQYVHEFGVRFPVGRDAEPSVSFTNYLISAVPQVVLLDKEGIVRQFQTQGRLLEMITALRGGAPKT